ncbi:hypothetical protein IHE45_19G110900 [Dioscorea alata]|uniref:Uncharacterized protein n=1 Tax=Dioscorea alata TaxID=55571 RepID=A0ACB7U0W7_DIOAL|nr:hypothetical protein IHE45_19G110900 [Dioscorea alata]
MFCGTGSFSHIEDQDDQVGGVSSSPKDSKKKHANHNPYSNRGLDKFSAVLAELDARKDKIMANAKDVSMVRFVYNNSHDWVPIIIKLSKNNPSSLSKQQAQHHNQNKKECTSPVKSETLMLPPPSEKKEKKEAMVMNKKKSFVWRRRTWMSSYYYWFMMMALILVCLLLFGRVFAICCTSIWWYLVPTLQAKKSVKKKDYARKLSDIRKIKNHNEVH